MPFSRIEFFPSASWNEAAIVKNAVAWMSAAGTLSVARQRVSR